MINSLMISLEMIKSSDCYFFYALGLFYVIIIIGEVYEESKKNNILVFHKSTFLFSFPFFIINA